LAVSVGQKAKRGRSLLSALIKKLNGAIGMSDPPTPTLRRGRHRRVRAGLAKWRG